MSEAYKKLKIHLDRAMAIQTAMTLFEWDNETMAPPGAQEYTSRVIGLLSGIYFETLTDESVKALAQECSGQQLEPAEAANLKELEKELKKLEVIPREEYEANTRLTARAASVWAKAREKQDFDLFAPVLKEVIQYQKKFAGYQARGDQKLYDVLLEEYEPGFDMETLDRFFELLKRELVPFLKEIREKGREIPNDFLKGDYPREKQERLACMMAEYLGFDFEIGVLAVSAHPFTTNLHNRDVRMTTHYSERVDSSLFSVIHETGHALYEQGIDDELTQTLVGQGASMGLHESQSRFFENIIGRSQAFWEPVYGRVQELFPEELGQVSLEQFVSGVNRVEPGLIRTEADELTYSLHILIRYELEKRIFQEDLEVEELPRAWAEAYEQYLGIRPENPAQGVLQDIHWSQGSFGYFPSYALGNAFGAQIYHHLRQEMDVDGLLSQGKVRVIRDYLRRHIHRYGKLKTSRQILKELTGEDFNPQYYIDYLKEKYGKLYLQ